MSVPPAFDLQGLLAEDQWIRRLSRRLAADPHRAEDLVQDAWVAALSARASGHRPRALRPWLGGVVRNLWIDWKRVGEERRRREQRSARGEALPSASELASELELRKQVAAALLELEEPYRRTLYLRFFRDLSLRAIAEAEGVSITAVHERLQRGLARLRARLDREHGKGKGSWAVALLGLARPSDLWHATLETLAMGIGLKTAVAVLALGGGMAWWWVERAQVEPEPPAVALATASDLAEPGPAEPRLADAPDPRGERLALPAAAPEPHTSPAEPPAESSADLARGRVADTRGAPVSAVAVGWVEDPSAPSALTGSDGAFALAPRSAGEHERVHCLEPDLVTLVPGEELGIGPEELLVVVAPRAAFGGVVLAPEGTPVAGATVSFRLRDALFRELGLQRSPQGEEPPHTTTDAQGRFELADLAGGEGVYLQIEAPGYFPAELELPARGALDLVAVLERNANGLVLAGLVVDEHGAPVEGARVSAGHEIVLSDAEGHFELRTHAGPGPFDEHGNQLPPDAGAQLVAVKPGLLPARERLADLDPRALIVLTLGAHPASIAGRVLDEQGRPRADVIVWPGDPTPFGRDLRAVGEGTTIAWQTTIEEELAGGFGQRGARTDDNGVFELGGLIERDYALLTFDPRTAERGGPWTVASGRRDVELVFAREPQRGRVAGRLVSARGRPIAGASVVPRRAGTDAHGQPPLLEHRDVETDADGHFEFTELALVGTELLLQKEPFFMRAVALADHPDPAQLELVEPLLCELQVDLTRAPDLADTLRVLDAAGRELETIESFGNGWSLGTEARITDGLSPVVSVKETGETLVLSKKGVEVLRLPLALDPDERTVVRP